MLALAYAVIIEPYLINVTHESFSFFQSGGGSGLIRIVFISDLHASYDNPAYFSHVVESVNAEKPDIILIGGDMAEGADSDMDNMSALGALKAGYGIYAVPGNHDDLKWGCGGKEDTVKANLSALGISMLRNEHQVLDIKGNRFALIGVDDPWWCDSDYGKAAEGIPGDLPQVILAHQESSIAGKPLMGRIIILSGHTHCGQVRIPFITDLILRLLGSGEYAGGRYLLPDGNGLYVTCGVAPGGIRFLAPPEVTVIELT